MTLLPIAPILLLPFILIFFVVVFPVWLVAMMVLGAIRLVLRLVLRRPGHPARARVEKAFQWVKSFGGLIDFSEKPAQ
jgi:hypothetical protein